MFTNADLRTGVVFVIGQIICAILVIYGATKKKTGVLLSVVVMEAVSAKALSVLGVLRIIRLFKVAETAAAAYVAAVCIVIYLLFSVYFLLAVSYYYRNLRDEQFFARLVKDRETEQMSSEV